MPFALAHPAARAARRLSPRAGGGALAWVVAAFAFLVAAGVAPAQPVKTGDIPGEVPKERQGLEVVEHLGEKIPLDLEFKDPSGQTVTLAKYFNDGGKPVLMTMVFFQCPVMCPTTLNTMGKALNELAWDVGDKFNVVVVSFDPRDTYTIAANEQRMRLAGYNRPQPAGLGQHWTFLTSQHPENARKLADALGFPFRFLPEQNTYVHLPGLFVLQPDGTISRYLYGSVVSAQTLKLGLLEASQGKIGTTVDRFFMWCFHYDPKAGSYVITAVRIMQVGCIITAVLLGGVLAFFWMLERRRRRAKARAAASASPAAGPLAPRASPPAPPFPPQPAGVSS